MIFCDEKKNAMEEKVIEEGYYKIRRKKGSHVNRKINSDGSKSAIQFFDGTNNLNGPVELIEVDESELMRIQNEQGIHPIVKYVIDNILAPYITRELERGTDYLLGILEERVIPKTKENVKKFFNNSSLYIVAFKDALMGKEPKALQLMREIKSPEASVEKTVVVNTTVGNKYKTEQEKEDRSPEEVEQLLKIMQANVVSLASCIRILSNTIVKDAGKNSEGVLAMKKEIERLSTEKMMDQISLLLDDRNRDLLDESSFEILSAFREGKFIVDGKMIPMSSFK